MNIATSTIGTETLVGGALCGMLAFDRHVTPAVVLSALLSTASPSIASSTRFEDTASSQSPTTHVLTSESPAIERIRELAFYQAGWDGPESVGPTVQTVRQAIAFARELQSLGNIIQPYISLAGDGEINFYWSTPELVLDLGFTGTGTYSYFGEAAGVELSADAAVLGERLPHSLVAALRA